MQANVSVPQQSPHALERIGFLPPVERVACPANSPRTAAPMRPIPRLNSRRTSPNERPKCPQATIAVAAGGPAKSRPRAVTFFVADPATASPSASALSEIDDRPPYVRVP